MIELKTYKMKSFKNFMSCLLVVIALPALAQNNESDVEINDSNQNAVFIQQTGNENSSDLEINSNSLVT